MRNRLILSNFIQTFRHIQNSRLSRRRGGFPNPNHLPDLHTAYRDFFEQIYALYGDVAIVIDATANWGVGPGEIHRVFWVQRRVVRDLASAGHKIALNRVTLTFAGRGMIKSDGVHYTQEALNELGETNARLLLTIMQRKRWSLNIAPDSGITPQRFFPFKP